MHRPLRIWYAVVTAFACSLLLPTGCRRDTARKELDFDVALPESWEVVRVLRLDTDGQPADQEWVILYAFDQPEQRAFAPVRCVVYHMSRREPKLPIIYPYQLQAPSWTYLGEGADRTSVRVEDVVTRMALESTNTYSSTNEVIVQSTNAYGFVNRVSIFQWRDNVRNKLLNPQEVVGGLSSDRESGQWYQCIGLFEGTLRVDLQRDRVSVWDRLNDRSQLARVSTHEPSGGPGGYLLPDNRLVAPVSSCVEFAFGMPANLVASPYPEKIVMAFHKQFAVAPEYGAQYLTEQAAQKRQTDPVWRVLNPNLSPVEGVCITQLGYNPELETRTEIQAFSLGSGQVRTVVETTANYRVTGQGLVALKVEWELVRDNNIWKISDIRSVRNLE